MAFAESGNFSFSSPHPLPNPSQPRPTPPHQTPSHPSPSRHCREAMVYGHTNYGHVWHEYTPPHPIHSAPPLVHLPTPSHPFPTLPSLFPTPSVRLPTPPPPPPCPTLPPTCFFSLRPGMACSFGLGNLLQLLKESRLRRRRRRCEGGAGTGGGAGRGQRSAAGGAGSVRVSCEGLRRGQAFAHFRWIGRCNGIKYSFFFVYFECFLLCTRL